MNTSCTLGRQTPCTCFLCSISLRYCVPLIVYCVQFDALLVYLTGRELLTMFARLRGVHEKQIKKVVDIEIARVDLKKYANKQCGSYRLVQ